MNKYYTEEQTKALRKFFWEEMTEEDRVSAFRRVGWIKLPWYMKIFNWFKKLGKVE